MTYDEAIEALKSVRTLLGLNGWHTSDSSAKPVQVDEYDALEWLEQQDPALIEMLGAYRRDGHDWLHTLELAEECLRTRRLSPKQIVGAWWAGKKPLK